MQEITKTVTFNGEEILFKTGKLAPRAESAILAQVGETVVLTIVTVNDADTQLDYFPLSVEYIEKFYAGGIISGSRFLKRERRPSDEAVLKARQIDHSIRSLFPKSYRKPVSVVVNVMAYDGVHDPETLAVTSASMALMVSSIPFAGPSASMLVGIQGDKFIINPSANSQEEMDAEFIISFREDRVLNIEGWGDQIPEAKMAELLDFAAREIKPLLDVQVAFQKEIGKTKVEVEELPVDKALLESVEKAYLDQITEGLYNSEQRSKIFAQVQSDFLTNNSESGFSANQVRDAIEYIARKVMRAGVLKEEKRTSGRKLNEIRKLDISTGYLPRVHGSAIFSRGITQSLSIVTLGSTRLVQTLESFEGEEEKSFMHHYNGPSYSLGEADRFSYYPGRREIGHGHIGENALKKMLPSVEEFPYTIRVVSEILSQRGSSSMAATCGTSLALMDAGVPIKAQVGGIALGLVTDDADLGNYKLLVDSEDVEDFYGDMDFKVTGTEQGVTAIQLDNKLMGVPVNILKDAFEAARTARFEILAAMNKVLDKPRAELSKYAPKVEVIKINPAKIGELIGPGGKVIKGIIEQVGEGVDIDIQDDGQVNITAVNEEQRKLALSMVQAIVAEPEIGKVYEGVIDKVVNFGAFVNVSPAITGLIHVSEMADKFVSDPTTIVKEGDKVQVKLIKIENGKMSFSMKAVNSEAKADKK